MQIKNILPRCSDLAKLGRPKTTPSATTGPATQNAAEPGGGLASSAAAQRIVSQYDVTDISPQSFSQMLQKLRQAGSLSGQDYQALSSIPGEVQKSGIAPDDSVNLLQLYAAKVQGLRGNRNPPPAQRHGPATRRPPQSAVNGSCSRRWPRSNPGPALGSAPPRNVAFRSAKERCFCSELVKKWGHAPRVGVILPVVRIGRRRQSPFFHKLRAKGDIARPQFTSFDASTTSSSSLFMRKPRWCKVVSIRVLSLDVSATTCLTPQCLAISRQ